MLEGLKVIEKGEAVIAGISVKNDPMKVKQIIGVQLQESHYFDYLKLKELLDLFGEFYHRKIDGLKLLREVQLEDKKKLIPSNCPAVKNSGFPSPRPW